MSARTTRRRFLDWFLGTSFGAALVAVVYPVARFLVPPARGEPTVDQIVAGKEAQFHPNSGKIFPFGSQPAILVRWPTGEFRAFLAKCTHYDCTVQYRADKGQIWCACHNGWYDLTGRNVSGPPPKPLEELQVQVDSAKGEVVVRRKA
jgi:Rieske Fe-S protein